MKTVIMAGGSEDGGTIAPDIPKPMIEIGELLVLEREIYCFQNQGFTDIILMVGL